MAVVIVHPEFGIYLGQCFGLGFFTLLDCAGQDTAVVFPTEAAARHHVIPWESNNDPDAYRYVSVTTARAWATIEELDAVGLAPFTEPMKQERLRNMPAAGRA